MVFSHAAILFCRRVWKTRPPKRYCARAPAAIGLTLRPCWCGRRENDRQSGNLVESIPMQRDERDKWAKINNFAGGKQIGPKVLLQGFVVEFQGQISDSHSNARFSYSIGTEPPKPKCRCFSSS